MSRTPPPELSTRKLVIKRPEHISSTQEIDDENSEEGDVFVDMTQNQVQVKVHAATPAHHNPRRKSLKSQSSVDSTTLDPLDAQKCEMARGLSICSVTSTDSDFYYTPCGSLTEEDMVKPAGEKDLAKESTEMESKKKRQDKMKDPCHNCIALRRQFSKSEEEIRKLRRQWGNCNEQMAKQVFTLREELFQNDVTLENYKQYAFKLEKEVYLLKVRVEREEVAKQDALKCTETLLHMAQNYSSQLPPCSPLHPHHHPPTHYESHTYYTPTQYRDHTHQHHNGSTHLPTQMTLGGLPLAQSTTDPDVNLHYHDHQ